MKAHKIIYVVLILSQIIGMVCLIFLYGVFAEFNGRKQELDIDNKYIDLSFEGVTIGEIKELGQHAQKWKQIYRMYILWR